MPPQRLVDAQRRSWKMEHGSLAKTTSQSAIDRGRPWLGTVGGDRIGAPPPLAMQHTLQAPPLEMQPIIARLHVRFQRIAGSRHRDGLPRRPRDGSQHPRGGRLENVSRELATTIPPYPTYVCICRGAMEQHIRSRTQHRGRIPSARHARNGSPPCRGERQERDKRERGLTVRARGGLADLARLRLVCCGGGRMFAGSTRMPAFPQVTYGCCPF